MYTYLHAPSPEHFLSLSALSTRESRALASGKFGTEAREKRVCEASLKRVRAASPYLEFLPLVSEGVVKHAIGDAPPFDRNRLRLRRREGPWLMEDHVTMEMLIIS